MVPTAVGTAAAWVEVCGVIRSTVDADPAPRMPVTVAGTSTPFVPAKSAKSWTPAARSSDAPRAVAATSARSGATTRTGAVARVPSSTATSGFPGRATATERQKAFRSCRSAVRSALVTLRPQRAFTAIQDLT